VKLISIQLKIWIVLISVLSIYTIVYFFSAEDNVLPKMTVQEKKTRFKKLIIPAIDTVYAKLMTRYQQISESIKSGNITDEIKKLKVEYKATSNEELLMALKPHPKCIAIAQAAMESSWATSRFFNEAYNIFGVWSFDKDEPRIAALQKRGDKTIWVKKYSSVEASVSDYYRTLARGRAFKEFRQLKLQTDNPFELVKKLDRYSEKGAKYGHELTTIIKFNKFNAYD
jgi:Bax protein